MEVEGLQPITLGSPLAERGIRPPQAAHVAPEKPQEPEEPLIEGDIIPPGQPTPVDNLQLTYDNEDISPR